MFKKSLLAAVLVAPLLTSTYASAQTVKVDPACVTKNTDGTEKVDMAKCPDGKTMGTAATTTAPAAGSDVTTTASTAPMKKDDLIISSDALNGAKMMSANDFIGKTVYTRANENIGEVNDVILSQNGVNAVILGVGGFLGLGEKNVAVSMSSIEIAKDGSSSKLIVDATKEQLNSAPKYDASMRKYMN